jgi:hypothetical protein
MSKTVPSQNRVVLAGAITRKKNHPAGKGHPDSGLRGRIITQQELDHRFSDVHGKVTRESSLPLALESLPPKFRHGGNKRKTVFRSGSRILQPDTSTPHHDACTTSRRGSDQQCLLSLLWPRRPQTLMSASARNSAISFRRGAFKKCKKAGCKTIDARF